MPLAGIAAIALEALLPLAKQALMQIAAHKTANPATTPAALAENPLMKLALGTVGAYQTTRDAALAAGVVTTQDPNVVTDAALIAGFEADAIHFRDHAADLIKKYSTP